MKPNARLVAFDALMRVTVDDAYLDRVLPAAFSRTGLSPEDRGLAQELAYGVLRRRALLDAAIARFVDRSLDKIDVPTMTALRLGAYQLLLLERIPPHAAVSETVEVIKHRRKSAQGLVNAVLRKLSKAERPPKEPSAIETNGRAAWTSLPDWLYDRLALEFERPATLPVALQEAVQTPASFTQILVALATPAHPSLRVLTRRLARQALLDRLQGQGASAWPLPHSAAGIGVERIGAVTDLEGFGRDFFAQDEAAQWVTQLAMNEQGPVLDACAAPGGKTLALWDLGLEPVTALEVQPGRTQLIKSTLEKAGVAASVVTADAQKPPFAPHTFKTVLVDAPCTGSGTLRRHPEMRWRMQPDAVERLASLQRSILAATSSLVMPGGALIYAVCSVFHEEGALQVTQFLAAHAEFTLERWISTLPALDTMDGFFAARLRRASGNPGRM